MGREYRFPVDVAWDGDRRTTATVEGKQPLDIATPPVFRGTDPDVWSPEDTFVAAAASCLAVTIAALADAHQLSLHNLDVHAEGVVGRRDDGKFGFIRIEQTVEVESDLEQQEAARALVDEAENTCLVSVSLALPVETAVQVRVPARVTS